LGFHMARFREWALSAAKCGWPGPWQFSQATPVSTLVP
jgi:hypothetical protein